MTQSPGFHPWLFTLNPFRVRGSCGTLDRGKDFSPRLHEDREVVLGVLKFELVIGVGCLLAA